MVFSSLTFLFLFLPIIIILYYLAPHKAKNFILLFFSLVFYSFGEPRYLLLILISCFINYSSALLMNKSQERWRLTIFILTLIFNIGALGYFKYADFMISNFNLIFNTQIPLLHVLLPLGISFYTFQSLSYVIDVYTRKVKANRSFWQFTTYITLFPQLIAGPIVRYQDIETQLNQRQHSTEKIAKGIERFIIGLAKKVLLANTLGEMVQLINDMEPTVLGYWLVAIFFLMQLYFDFSGYSDMAIGLGRIFGFEFLENFNYPFLARSMTDFWRRWHMSLSRWFKDYVYIPLKGSRVKPARLIFNLLFVWALTGLWHGAEWNFLLWGIYFGCILILEKLCFTKFLQKHSVFGHIYTIVLILIGFIIFQYPIKEWADVFKGLFNLSGIPLFSQPILYYFKSYFVILMISLLSSTPMIKKLYHIGCNKYPQHQLLIENIGRLIILGLLILCIAFIVDSSFNPFLYFRF